MIGVFYFFPPFLWLAVVKEVAAAAGPAKHGLRTFSREEADLLLGPPFSNS
jgi:hypothetical protein